MLSALNPREIHSKNLLNMQDCNAYSKDSDSAGSQEHRNLFVIRHTGASELLGVGTLL